MPYKKKKRAEVIFLAYRRKREIRTIFFFFTLEICFSRKMLFFFHFFVAVLPYLHKFISKHKRPYILLVIKVGTIAAWRIPGQNEDETLKCIFLI